MQICNQVRGYFDEIPGPFIRYETLVPIRFNPVWKTSDIRAGAIVFGKPSGHFDCVALLHEGSYVPGINPAHLKELPGAFKNPY
jgi:hypothetical protein